MRLNPIFILTPSQIITRSTTSGSHVHENSKKCDIAEKTIAILVKETLYQN